MPRRRALHVDERGRHVLHDGVADEALLVAEPEDDGIAVRRDVHELAVEIGHQDEPPTSPEEMSVKSFLARPVPHKPGTHFRYNTAATFMLSAIVQKVSGQTALEYLRPRLFEPLGIEKPQWDSNFEGINLGGYGLRVAAG